MRIAAGSIAFGVAGLPIVFMLALAACGAAHSGGSGSANANQSAGVAGAAARGSEPVHASQPDAAASAAVETKVAPAVHDAGAPATRDASTGRVPTGTPGGHETSPSERPSVEQPRATRLPPCEPAPGFESFELERTWQFADPASTDLGLPLVASLNDDNGDGAIDANDTPDVLVLDYTNHTLFALDGATGEEHFRIDTGTGYGNHYAVGDVDRDGRVEIIGAEGEVVAFTNEGKLKWRAEPTAMGARDLGSITLADLDGDGAAEIVSDAELFDNVGHHLLTFSPYDGTSPPLAVDLDGDGQLEVIHGRDAYDRHGDVTFVSQLGYNRTFPGIADFDHDGMPELVFAGMDEIEIVDNAGRERARITVPNPDPQSNGLIQGPPVIADVDGDGVPEIGVTGMDHYSVYDATLTRVWSTPIDYGAYVVGSTAFDFDGDGNAEIVHCDRSALHVFEGKTGRELARFPIPGIGIGYPVIGDVDGDGSAEIVVATANLDGKPARVLVLGAAHGRFMPARKIWNQYNYFVENVADDGKIPAPQPQSVQLSNGFRMQARINPNGHVCDPHTAVDN